MSVCGRNIRALRCASAAALASVLAPLALAPAFSADLGVAPIYRAPPAAVSTWTGSYIGISGGGAWGNAVVHNDPTGVDQTPRFDLHGGIIGITSGLNIQNGAIVYGYEGDTSITSKRGSAFEFPPPIGFPGFSNEVREPWLSTYRGRLGYTQNNWLLYATAGGALAQVENNVFGPISIQRRARHFQAISA
jgi:outer membrane immunogenic protein